MAQFDVHRTKAGQRSVTPYAVVIQSRRFDPFRRRVIIPLVDESTDPPIEGRSVVLHTLQVISIPADHLGEKVCSLTDDGDRIIAALDLLISRAWG